MDKIIYFGDSITAQFELLKRNNNVLNFGIGGDTTIKLIGRVKDVIVQNPDKLFLHIGINDYLLKQGIYEEKLIINFESTYRTLLEHINDNLKSTTLNLISIFPVVNIGENSIVVRYNNEIDKINEFIKKMALEFNANYIDIASKLKSDNNSLVEDFTKDGLHLSDNGYKEYYMHISKHF